MRKALGHVDSKAAGLALANEKGHKRPVLRTELRARENVLALSIPDQTQRQPQASCCCRAGPSHTCQCPALLPQENTAGLVEHSAARGLVVQGGQIRRGAPRMHALQQQQPARPDARQARPVPRQKPAFRPSGPARHRPGCSMPQARACSARLFCFTAHSGVLHLSGCRHCKAARCHPSLRRDQPACLQSVKVLIFAGVFADGACSGQRYIEAVKCKSVVRASA